MAKAAAQTSVADLSGDSPSPTKKASSPAAGTADPKPPTQELLSLILKQKETYESTIATLVAELDHAEAERRFLREQLGASRDQADTIEKDFLSCQEDRTRLKEILAAREADFQAVLREMDELRLRRVTDAEEIKELRALAANAFEENAKTRRAAMDTIRLHQAFGVHVPSSAALPPSAVPHGAPLSPAPAATHRAPAAGSFSQPAPAAAASGSRTASPSPLFTPQLITAPYPRASPNTGALPVDPQVSTGIAISHYGHVAVSTCTTGPALCIYTDASSSQGLHFEAEVRSGEVAAVVIGVASSQWLATHVLPDALDLQVGPAAVMSPTVLGPQAPRLSSALRASAVPSTVLSWKSIPLKCCLKGDGGVVLSSSGHTVETRFTVPAMTEDAGATGSLLCRRVACRLDTNTRKLHFYFMAGHGAASTALPPVLVPPEFLIEPLCPFVVLPCRGDEVVVRQLHS